LLAPALLLWSHLRRAVSTPHFGSASDAVLSAMRSVHFLASGSECTWYGFYLGFGYQVSIFFLFSAFVTWFPWFLGGRSLPEQLAWAPVCSRCSWDCRASG
jgi:hypothetical protein